MSDGANGNSFPVYALFDSFGNRQTDVTTPGTASAFQWGGGWGYQSEYQDASVPGLGLVYMEQRYYDPAIGRFVSADPMGLAAGLNQYGYAGNNPVNGVDPTGLETWFDPIRRPLDAIAGGVRSGAERLKGRVNGAIASGPVGIVGATAINTAIDFGTGIVTFPAAVFHLGEGTGTFAGDPSWQNVPGVIGDAGIAVGTAIPAFSAARSGCSALGRLLSPPYSMQRGSIGLASEGGLGNVGGGELAESQALSMAERWLGPGYREIAPGVFRSADGRRQFRMTTSDFVDPEQGPHIHFEAVGRGGRKIIENSHVRLRR